VSKKPHREQTTLQRYNTENLKQIFPEKELRGLSPYYFYIHVSVSDLNISMIGPHTVFFQNRQTDDGNI
jgi:hypothetical protein